MLINNTYYKGVIAVLFSAFGFGMIPVFAMFAYKAAITIPTLLFCRFSLAALLFFAYHVIRKNSIKLSFKSTGMVFFLGFVCYTIQSFCYFSSIKYIQPSFAALLLYTFPVMVALLAWIVNKERPAKTLSISIAISLAGLVLFLGTSFGVIDYRGILLALTSALVYGLFIFFSREVLHGVDGLVVTAYVALFSSMGFLSFGSVTGSISFSFAPPAWLSIFGLSLFSTILAIGLLMKGIEILGPTRTSIISIMEPVFAIIFSTILFHDRFTLYQGIGGIGILGGVCMTILSQPIHETRIRRIN